MWAAINAVDLVIFCGLVGLGVVGIRSYRLLTVPQAPVRWKLDETIEVFCAFPGVEQKLAQEIYLGAVDKDPTGRTVIEVLEIMPASPPLKVNLSPAFQVPVHTSRSLEQVVARLRLYGDVREDGRFYCKGQPILLGGPVELRTSRTVIQGTVKAGPEKNVFLLVRAKDISEKLAMLLSPGDPVYDPGGMVSGEMISVSFNNTNAEQKKRFQQIESNAEMAAEVWVKLRCEGQGSLMFLGMEPIGIGKAIDLSSDEYHLTGEVIAVSKTPPGSVDDHGGTASGDSHLQGPTGGIDG